MAARARPMPNHRRGTRTGAATRLYLYTSGTTGKPRRVVRDHGGHAVAMRLKHAGGLRHAAWRRVLGPPLMLGWVGRPLLHCLRAFARRLHHRAYEGKKNPIRTPDAGAFWRVCGRVRPSRHCRSADRPSRDRKEDPNASLGGMRGPVQDERLYLAGERLGTRPPAGLAGGSTQAPDH